MVEPVTAILSGIALVKSATSFIKDNINTVNDISDIAKQIDQMFEGQQQIHKERNKQANSTANELGLSSVAQSVIESKLAEERISEIRTLINYRFPTSKPPSTWDLILMERKRRIEERKQAIKKEKQRILKKRQEIEEYVKYGFIALAVILFLGVAVGVTLKFFVSVSQPIHAHEMEFDDGSCLVYNPKWWLMCLNEGREITDTELYLDYKQKQNNWIIEKD